MKPGDRIVCMDKKQDFGYRDIPDLTIDKIYIVETIRKDLNLIYINDGKETIGGYFLSRFVLL